jgi:hypothetical protein
MKNVRNFTVQQVIIDNNCCGVEIKGLSHKLEQL